MRTGRHDAEGRGEGEGEEEEDAASKIIGGRRERRRGGRCFRDFGYVVV